MNLVLWNGEFVGEQEVIISKEDRGYQFGDGVYEVIKVYSGQLFELESHVDRLYRSAGEVEMAMPHERAELLRLLEELCKRNRVESGKLYLQVTRGACARNHAYPDPSRVPSLLNAYTSGDERPLAKLRDGVKVVPVEDIRWLRCDIKSLNLLPNVMAKQEAVKAGAYEALLHRGEVVTEGSSSNAYGIRDGVLYTHPADNLILNGITRRLILELCEEIGLPVREHAFTMEELHRMDEVIISSTSAEVMPVVRVGDRAVGAGEPGPWTRKLQQAFERRIPAPHTV